MTHGAIGTMTHGAIGTMTHGVIDIMMHGAIGTMTHGAGNSCTMKYMRPIVDSCVEGWRRVHRDDVSLPELFRRSDGPKLVFRNFALRNSG